MKLSGARITEDLYYIVNLCKCSPKAASLPHNQVKDFLCKCDYDSDCKGQESVGTL